MFNIKKTIFIYILGVLLILIIFTITIFKIKKNSNNPEISETTETILGVAGDPVDITMDFYRTWIDEITSSSSDPYNNGFINNNALEANFRQKLIDSKNTDDTKGIDPVLCQNDIPSRLRSKLIYQNNEGAKVIIFAKDTPSIQSIVSLKNKDSLWQITDIGCSIGEQDPNQGEFSFDHEGQLLKSSLKPPLNNQYWHLVFEENGIFGHTAPLYIDESSYCIISDNQEEICKDSMFFETQKVHVQGNMTEAGVEVKRIEIIQ